MRVDTLTSIKVFRQVVESGSFVAAAEQLELSTAMVSRHVMQLEKRLGVRLLNRNSRTLSVTEPGRVYIERCKTILDDLEQTELELGALGTVARGTLRISCPSWFAGQRMADALCEFRRRYPEIVVDISFEDRKVDLVEEGYDLTMRVTFGDSLPAGLIARPVRQMGVFICASREYLRRHGAPNSPQEVAGHDFVGVGGLDSLTFAGPEGKIEVPLRVVLRYRALAGAANAIAAGIGLGTLPDEFFFDPIFKDELVPLLEYPIQGPTLYTLYLVYVSRKHLPLKIRAFIDFILEWGAKMPIPKVTGAR
jgi:DNA-binding transcriptional LysR family regulator